VWLYLDGAHTEESVEACAHWFADVCSAPPLSGAQTKNEHVEERRVLVFNCNQNRSAAKLLTKLTAITTARLAGQRERDLAPFDAAIFSTFVTHAGGPDGRTEARATDSVSERTKWQHANAQIWRSLAKEQQHSDKNASLRDVATTVVDTIPAALDAVAHLRDCWRQQAETSTQLRVRVLVTGSLYLVGGVLEVLLSRNALPASVLHL
jgi:folylpolyglutamate synthase